MRPITTDPLSLKITTVWGGPPFGTHPYHRSVAIPMHIWRHKLYPLLGFLAEMLKYLFLYVFVGFAVFSDSLFNAGRLLGDPPKTKMF